MFISERVEERVVKTASEKLDLPISLVDKLNSFQWRNILEATSSCRTIEITGLARLSIKDKVVDSNIQINLNKINVAEQKLNATDDLKTINRITKRIEEYKGNIEFLKSKLK